MNTLVHFEARRSAGDILAQKLVEQFERLKIPYIYTGYEYFDNNTDLTRIAFSLLKKNKDGNSSYLRFFPDFTTVGNTKSLFVECKNSTGIEKDCYYNYKNMQEFNNTNIVLYLKNEKFCFLPDLKFKEANEWNYRTQMKIPITDKVWVEPRKMPKKEYDLYLERMQYKTSGCSYALIDFDKTKTFDIEYLKQYLI
jgi:hypothetical protein